MESHVAPGTVDDELDKWEEEAKLRREERSRKREQRRREIKDEERLYEEKKQQRLKARMLREEERKRLEEGDSASAVSAVEDTSTATVPVVSPADDPPKQEVEEVESSSECSSTDPKVAQRTRAEQRKKEIEEEHEKWEEKRLERLKAREDRAAKRREEVELSMLALEQADGHVFTPCASSKRGGGGTQQTSEEQLRDSVKIFSSIKETEYDTLLQQNRIVAGVRLPRSNRLTEEHVFNSNGHPRPDLLRMHFQRQGLVDMDSFFRIVRMATDLFKRQKNILRLDAPVVVVGDIHGQFFDLCKLLDSAGHPSDTAYLFLGDYVDRGSFSTEVILLLYSLTICYPDTFHLLRGNHETRKMTSYFNCRLECIHKYSRQAYDALMLSFDAMPIAAVVRSEKWGRFFCVHGGLSPTARTLEELEALDRFCEPSVKESGTLFDTLWSDPVDDASARGLLPSQLTEWMETRFEPNETRGASWIYGRKAVEEFLQKNGLSCIVRAHEVQRFGFHEHRFRDHERDLAMVITVFSAPNYCDTYQNRSAFLRITHEEYQFGQMAWVDHPYVLPDFQNVFSYSMPFVAENMSRFFLNLLELCDPTDDDDDDDDEDEGDSTKARARSIHEKVRNIGRTSIILKMLREKKEQQLCLDIEEEDLSVGTYGTIACARACSA
eukprot:TRINITY_DN777_c0_g1_i1.p1 TRINITY_DN777_c0_g1~~TRINITY_DN777_c0_g1_i1.p1  ORF type:complete len:666 (+),score=151.32 TRINITY_DN777_c0_g1_i1:299-2296(+)